MINVGKNELFNLYFETDIPGLCNSEDKNNWPKLSVMYNSIDEHNYTEWTDIDMNIKPNIQVTSQVLSNIWQSFKVEESGFISKIAMYPNAPMTNVGGYIFDFYDGVGINPEKFLFTSNSINYIQGDTFSYLILDNEKFLSSDKIYTFHIRNSNGPFFIKRTYYPYISSIVHFQFSFIFGIKLKKYKPRQEDVKEYNNIPVDGETKIKGTYIKKLSLNKFGLYKYYFNNQLNPPQDRETYGTIEVSTDLVHS